MPTDEQAIRELFAAWKQATLDQDVDALLGFVTDDVIFLVPRHAPIRGKAAMEAMYRQVLGRFRFEQDWVFEEIQVLGDWGFCWGHDSATMLPLDGGPAVDVRGIGLSILRKRPDGSWAVARSINNVTLQTA
jgi:uncharacterized protein (TIGR02246 family)